VGRLNVGKIDGLANSTSGIPETSPHMCNRCVQDHCHLACMAKFLKLNVNRRMEREKLYIHIKGWLRQLKWTRAMCQYKSLKQCSWMKKAKCRNTFSTIQLLESLKAWKLGVVAQALIPALSGSWAGGSRVEASLGYTARLLNKTLGQKLQPYASLIDNAVKV
jgi:hypothetical protein